MTNAELGTVLRLRFPLTRCWQAQTSTQEFVAAANKSMRISIARLDGLTNFLGWGPAHIDARTCNAVGFSGLWQLDSGLHVWKHGDVAGSNLRLVVAG